MDLFEEISDKEGTSPILYVIVPCYNEKDVLPETNRRLESFVSMMIKNCTINPLSRILYVDDGSVDNTWSMIEKFHERSHIVHGVKLSGNSGHQNALMAGLSVAKDDADIMITIDADLQDDIEIIPEMIQKYVKGSDIVYGVRTSREKDTFFKRITALTFYKMTKFWGVKSVYNHADYRLMSKRAVGYLLQFRERNLFLRGIVPLMGFKSDKVYYERNKRLAGESKYSFLKMLSFAIDGITSFSIKPVHLIFTLGILFLIVALVILIYVIHAYFSGSSVPGWLSIILSIWFIGGCILIGLGVVGEYIGKIFLEVKDRPRFFIEKELK